MIQFGTGGWRALIGDDFTKRNVQILCASIAQLMKETDAAKRGIVIGFDRRFLSDVAAFWAAEVFAAQGIPCRLIRKSAPTPLIMYAVKEMDFPFGMAVTASHNPALWNGIKVFISGGRDADEGTTKAIEAYTDGLASAEIAVMPYEDGLASGIIQEIDPLNQYIDSILSVIDTEAIKNARLKIVLDPMYGVSKTSLSTILISARCDVSVIHDRHDTLFGGKLPSPNESTMTDLINMVLEQEADIGIATDGDADRLGIINNKGEFLHPNEILVLLYYYLVQYKGMRGAVVRNLCTTHLLDKLAESFGEVCYEVPVGFKHVSSKMLEANAILGGESSGGLTVRGHVSGKDGIYAAALLVEMIAITGRPLSDIYKEITDKFGEVFMAESSLPFKQSRKEEILHTVMTEKALPAFARPVKEALYYDGLKVVFEGGYWLSARFSGTEPLLRIFCEMPSMEEAREACALMQDFLQL